MALETESFHGVKSLVVGSVAIVVGLEGEVLVRGRLRKLGEKPGESSGWIPGVVNHETANLGKVGSWRLLRLLLVSDTNDVSELPAQSVVEEGRLGGGGRGATRGSFGGCGSLGGGVGFEGLGASVGAALSLGGGEGRRDGW